MTIAIKYHDCITVLGGGGAWYVSHCHNGICGIKDKCHFIVCGAA